MKVPVLLIWISLGTISASAEIGIGKVDKFGTGAYTLTYPNQTIHIYFNYLPDNGLENIFIEYDLSENEKVKIVQSVKNQIDDLPLSFIDSYLNIDIFPLYIKNSTEFGYVLDDQIVIEASKIKYNMSFSNSIQSSLIHEIGHMIENKSKMRHDSKIMKDYLKDMHRKLDRSQNNVGSGIYEAGYVSRYANGEMLNYYSEREEFAELFAHLICKENRKELLEYTEQHPGAPLTDKVNRFLDFLDHNIPELGREYIIKENEIATIVPVELDDQDEKVLLSAHEMKSNEAMDFSSFPDYKEELPVDQEPEFVFNDNYEPDIIQSEDDYQYLIYRNPTDDSQAYVSDQNSTNKKTKKKKKRRGRGLLIAGTALYIALQLMK